ncbi:ABC transporter ATP-binding protein [Legionella septentrionalis]|uniref:ATP-binding cassette domain-containing protein n=1 Tax=Legionella septentrionalis TaxID=2498109 RepID=A0A433JGW7_9GAMM|nr:ATP-binding cassette domain-containing protein [Legionella septentrionalis]RUQ81555.1 ATP-binding cassette domain-containing protein [Legionella septentrionalis]
MQCRIEINHLSKIFYHHVSDAFRSDTSAKKPLSLQDKVVLSDINFTIESGETVGIIGRNGAGKSTLLSIIAGVSEQTQGEVIISGKVTAVMTLGIGLREDLTGRENIYLDGQIQGKSRAEMDVMIADIIEFAELSDFIDKPVKIYSTGMKSRLAFSMLVGIEPEILIIDEALSAGDAFFAEKASKKIKEICRKGKIVILVSHSMATIEAMCDRCIWLEKGKVLLDDTPAVVTQAYLKKVREEDQSRELEHMQAEISQIDEKAHYQIQSIALKLAGSDYQQSIFYTKDPFAIEIAVAQTHAGMAHAHIIIERIDGLVVAHERYDCKDSEGSKFLLKLSLPALVLNKGYYQLKVEIHEDNLVSNHFTRFFEVKNERPPKGGMPLLQYPAQIILLNEEVSVCSDSIELITE